jgi:hypothetical protein
MFFVTIQPYLNFAGIFAISRTNFYKTAMFSMPGGSNRTKIGGLNGYYFLNIFAQMSHNVPAVCDGLAARMRKGVAFPGPTNCGWNEPWEASAT